MEEAFDAGVVEAFYNMESGDSFAARIEEEGGSSLGPRTEYCRVVRVYGRSSRESGRIMKIKHRCEPTRDHWISNTIYHTEDGAHIKRLGPPSIDIHGVTTNALAVDYTPDHTLVATCDSCGNTGVVPVSESDLPTTANLVHRDDELVTSCCSGEWTTSLE
jgi:hypothetical protein